MRFDRSRRCAQHHVGDRPDANEHGAQKGPCSALAYAIVKPSACPRLPMDSNHTDRPGLRARPGRRVQNGVERTLPKLGNLWQGKSARVNR
ncbi:hypothetical protein PA7_21330 [Pseudonocardia asaccharolytica DSM 44247 = NBRC 16224]|uniref:Uncharacterized protein n=1 Tax=Pseudonocardia asaccharolytica DSM 44247 = NBRC 16224 TaxID=1123024 RepID=A0A511D0K4_9PSEU|nr:hypothetical protein PA7_21330 [Pseudonocardia asaccharolytica DSM 44247 = NBRC 16224]